MMLLMLQILIINLLNNITEYKKNELICLILIKKHYKKDYLMDIKNN